MSNELNVQTNIIAVINPKGGVGKSTVIAQLAASLARKSKVHVLDMDPQESLLSWSEYRDSPARFSVEKASSEELENLILESASEATDYIFIDVPGESEAGQITRMAITLADLVLVPMRDGGTDMHAAAKNLLPTIELAKALKASKILILPSVTHPSASSDKIRDAVAIDGVQVMENAFSQRKLYPVCMLQAQTLDEAYKATRSKKEKKIINKARRDVDNLVREIKEVIHG